MTSARNAPSRLIATVDALRLALAESSDLLGFTLGGTIDEETAAAAEADGVPRRFLDFCRLLNGVGCGPSVQLFSLREAEEHQFYCEPVVDSPLPLSPEKLYCVGMIQEAPVFLDRAGGEVLGAPEEGADWPDAERFDQLAPSVEEFFLERLATFDEYKRLALVDDELVEYDDWLKLLRRAGLAD
ncbi:MULTISPECIES: hypothetical protein [Streptomyces]|uniref:SMI1/KNR4 family protein n=1 Tax=Streptomyces doebereineriae TaxID=3075528 RepID=A0ABU2VMC4_9ACTN|nr:hypothetical protein [Streptomyces sp. DSM 41640]MDT0486754.1 hypothetical protein [Streptomyces sp. DSM 41640]